MRCRRPRTTSPGGIESGGGWKRVPAVRAFRHLPHRRRGTRTPKPPVMRPAAAQIHPRDERGPSDDTELGTRRPTHLVRGRTTRALPRCRRRTMKREDSGRVRGGEDEGNGENDGALTTPNAGLFPEYPVTGSRWQTSAQGPVSVVVWRSLSSDR
jgi:hypothetical protein